MEFLPFQGRRVNSDLAKRQFWELMSGGFRFVFLFYWALDNPGWSLIMPSLGRDHGRDMQGTLILGLLSRLGRGFSGFLFLPTY